MSLIQDYLKLGEPTTHTIRCFVGMIETDEITWKQLIDEAGGVVAAEVANAYNDIHDGDNQ